MFWFSHCNSSLRLLVPSFGARSFSSPSSAYYILGIPIGILVAFHFDFQLAGLWIGLMVALMYSSILSVWIGIVRADWEVEATKARERAGGKPADESY